MLWKHGAVACLAMLLLAGCAGLVGQGPLEPDGARQPWTATGASPWVVMSGGCGFCSGQANVTEAWAVVIYDDGHVLWFEHGLRSSDEGPVGAGEDLEEYVPVIERIVLSSHAYHLDRAQGIQVHDVATARLENDEWDRVREFMTEAIEDAEDPGPPNWGCDDCSGYGVDVYSPKRLNATLHESDSDEYGNYRDGDPWGRIVEQMAFIALWVKPVDTGPPFGFDRS